MTIFHLLLLIFTFILKCFFFNEVECYSYNSTIYVIDRVNDWESTYYDSWLVHRDHIVPHLRLDILTIDGFARNGGLTFSLNVGEIYISQYIITPINWSHLIIRHPEMVYDGCSCIIDYDSYTGPRHPAITVGEFLFSYCR
jgi:hypothetical protein